MIRRICTLEEAMVGWEVAEANIGFARHIPVTRQTVEDRGTLSEDDQIDRGSVLPTDELDSGL